MQNILIQINEVIAKLFTLMVKGLLGKKWTLNVIHASH
jgi:hypothetical protein